jgi:pimeloyl-ACP methyl ester carboxylesterase
VTQPIPLATPLLQTLQSADGRDLTWQEFGVRDGRPALYFHGGGSASFEAGIFHREAVAQRIRMIATNRPGAGGASLKSGRPAAGYADDITELLDHLDVEPVHAWANRTAAWSRWRSPK